MSKRKRPEQLTPVIRWNAYTREYEKALMTFARELTKSVSYHALAALRRTDVITSDSSPTEAPRDIKATLTELFRRWDNKASELGPKLTEKQLKRLLGKDAGKETAKAMEAFNIARSQELGLEYYMWDTAGDERVSTGYGGHAQLDGRIFRYDKAEAIIDSYGHKGHPGQRINCRCTSLGVFLKPGERIVKAKDGYGYEISR